MSHAQPNRTRSGKFQSVYTKAERQQRWDICTKYLKRHPTLDAARKAAAKDGVSFNTSVWITALSKILQNDVGPWERQS